MKVVIQRVKKSSVEINNKIEYLKSVDILVIDDIGAEKVTEWGRDEVLGTILASKSLEIVGIK